jgi:hypothetical protein
MTSGVGPPFDLGGLADVAVVEAHDVGLTVGEDRAELVGPPDACGGRGRR